ncbi:Tll0287-like domain-containing protein [Alteromonas sp. a30]|uniref:Tll0287-like domain-containing protein n=1 Tax=Alteromonas sp. a30 TaxID=2730917 RepID=UPI00227FFBCC|nr:DUF3365 domain-containing protein [Alteromonas sp. a30]MCY7296806.1 DUF3365 domain-containing protein [Alteromonas sp. a30]
MKNLTSIYAVVLATSFYSPNVLSHSGEVHPPEGDEYLVDIAYKKTHEFSRELKLTLHSAIAKGGFAAGISACNSEAPEIKTAFSKDGWEIGRTSLKTRNPKNSPDEWEAKILKEFQRDKDNGAEFSELAHSEIIEKDGQRIFRFMKAIPAKSMCLTCHGSRIGPSLSAKLKWKYPNDKAVNYRVDDIRGAFTLTKKL